MRTLTVLTAIIGTMVAATAALALGKLAHLGPAADWPWWAVAVPLWGPWALVSAAAVVLLVGVAGDRGMQRAERWARNRN